MKLDIGPGDGLQAFYSLKRDIQDESCSNTDSVAKKLKEESKITSQEKWNTKVMQNLGGQIRCIVGDIQATYLRKMRPFSWPYKGKPDHQEKVPTLPPSQALNCPAHTRDTLENFPMYDKRLHLHLQQPAWKDSNRNRLSYIVRTIIKLILAFFPMPAKG